MKKPQMQYIGQQSKQQPQRQSFFNRTIIPSKVIDPLLISTLLLKVSTDEINVLELGNFITSNGITINDMLNEDGESILHLIISNENISSRKKLEIIKYLKANFTLLSSYDKNGRTPLHLAVQNHLTDIVKELIESGHDVNALDNFYKSTLHYAVMGKKIETPEKKEKTLIPDKKTKIKSKLIKNLTENLIKYMEKDDTIKMFFNNQYSTIYNSKIMFNKEITNILESTDVVNKIVDIIANPQLSKDAKDKQIFEKTAECNKSVKALLTTKLQNVKKEIKMERNIENGWGPTNLNVNKILEHKNYNEFNDILESKSLDKLNKIITISTETNNDLLSYYNTINSSIYKIMSFTTSLLFMTVFYMQLVFLENLAVPGTTYFNNTELLIQRTIINELMYDPVIKPLICDTYVYDPRLNFNVKYNLSTNQIESGNDIYTGVNYLNTPFQPIDESRILNSINDLATNPKLAQFVNDVNALFTGGHTINIPGLGVINTMTTDQIMQIPPVNPIYYITKKINILNNNIYKQEIDVTNTHILQFITLLKNNPYDRNVLNHLSELNIHIYNLSNIIPKIFIEYEKIRDILISVKEKLYNGISISGTFPGGNTHEISIFHKECIKLLDDSIKDINKKLSELNIQMFNAIRKYHGIQNKIIEYINLVHSINYTKIYFNQFNEGNLFTNKTDTINNLFYLPINDDNKFFKSYDELINFIKNKNDETNEKNNKTKLINKFLLQFNNKNINIYIDNTNPTPITNGINGLIKGTITQINNLDIILGEISINYDDIYIDTYNNINYTNSNPATKQGNLEIIKLNSPLYDFLKERLAFPIITPIIDEFYNIQKYIITRYILTKIYDYILASTPQPVPNLLTNVVNNLKESINELKNDIDTSINTTPNDISMILITVGKIIDKIYNANLDNILNITTNDFGYRYYRNTIDKVSPSVLESYRIINITELNKIFINQVTFDDIVKSIYKLFRKDRKLRLYNYVENEFIREVKNDNIFKISSDVIGDNPTELYYKFNKDIINLLLKNGADINTKDKDGNTPIMIAMIQNNNNLIDYILNNQKYQNISVFNKKSKNRMGIRPFDMCVQSLKVIIDNYQTQLNDDTIKNITKEMNDRISKLTKIKHTMRFNNILLKIVLYLLNHNFYSILNNYNYQNNDVFHNVFFNNITNEITKLPLLTVLPNIKVSYHKPVDKLMDNEINTNTTSLTKLNELKTQRQLLNAELIDLNHIPAINRNRYRIDEIQDNINKIDNDIRNLEPSPNYITDKITNINNQKTRNNNLNQLELNNLILNMNVPISKDILKMYEEIINNIHRLNDDDYRTYMSLWETLIETDVTNDSTQIINKILNKCNNIFKDCLNSKNLQNFDLDTFNVLETSINLCKNYVNDYFELPYTFDGDNYVLNDIINIFIHVIKNTLLVNLYHIIEKLVRTELIAKIQRLSGQTEIEYERELDDKVQKIMNSTINNTNIKNYIFNILPEKVLKNILNLYENDDDDDKKNNIITLLEFINKILESNTVIQINKDGSNIITTLDTHVYPYFKEYLEATIINIKKLTDGYLSMILNLSSKLNLFKHIINKALNEKY